MRILLDTDTYLWLSEDPDQLPEKVAAALASAENELLLSIASLWEMAIKVAKKQLKLPADHIAVVVQHLESFEISLLPIEPEDISVLETLPLIHKDPFDRMIVSQALRHDLPIATIDGQLSKYGATILWD